MSDLVKRLREAANKSSVYWNLGNEAADAIERKDAAIAELVAICAEFVRRVECGEIRSKRTYSQMKAAIAKYDIPKDKL